MADTATGSGPRESIDAKRKDDQWRTARMVLEIAIAVIGFFLVTTLKDVKDQLKDNQNVTTAQGNEISAIKATADARDKAVNEQICDIRSAQLSSQTRLEAWMSKLSDKVDRIVEKVGSH